jgi:hypothetical protein
MSKYNIDALRNDDGTYRAASANLIRGALRCGHTAHLQVQSSARRSRREPRRAARQALAHGRQGPELACGVLSRWQP